MKKITKKFALLASTLFTLVFLVGTPIVVAQSSDTLDSTSITTLDSSTDTSTADTSSTETATVPDTGIAPSENRVLMNSVVFAGGALLGAGVGFGVLQLRKKTVQR